MTSPDPLAAAYRTLARRARDTNLARAAELGAIVEAWREAGSLSDAQRRKGRDLAHGLRGSAGTFGHEAASRTADELEDMLADGETPHLDQVAALLDRISEELAHAPELGR